MNIPGKFDDYTVARFLMSYQGEAQQLKFHLPYQASKDELHDRAAHSTLEWMIQRDILPSDVMIDLYQPTGAFGSQLLGLIDRLASIAGYGGSKQLLTREQESFVMFFWPSNDEEAITAALEMMESAQVVSKWIEPLTRHAYSTRWQKFLSALILDNLVYQENHTLRAVQRFWEGHTINYGDWNLPPKMFSPELWQKRGYNPPIRQEEFTFNPALKLNVPAASLASEKRHFLP